MTNQPSHIFMIRPVSFGFNHQTESTNSFQKNEEGLNANEIQQRALNEFDEFVNKLKANKINVTVFDDTPSPLTPDAIFPNNWISFHESNTIVVYPMMAENRRLERRYDILNTFKNTTTTIIDLSFYENENKFLEGTGSIVFDYENKIAYANISPRTYLLLLSELCKKLDYDCFFFKALDKNKKIIYHTNVMLCIGKGFAVICEECFARPRELESVLVTLKNTNHEIISINYEQLNSFAGNMYQLFNKEGESFIVMSKQAYQSLNEEQKTKLSTYGTSLYSNLETIEKYGGGSARCMIADIRF